MRRKLTGTGFDEITGPSKQHGAAALRGVGCRRLGMKRDPEIVQTIKTAAIWPDIDIERDNTRRCAGGDGWNRIRPARPPMFEHGAVSRRIEVPVLGERKFTVPTCDPR